MKPKTQTSVQKNKIAPRGENAESWVLSGRQKPKKQETKKTKKQKTQKKQDCTPQGEGSDAECWVLSFFFVFLFFCFLVCVCG